MNDTPRQTIWMAFIILNGLFLAYLHVKFWRPFWRQSRTQFFTKKMTRLKVLWTVHLSASFLLFVWFSCISAFYYAMVYANPQAQAWLHPGIGGAIMLPLLYLSIEFFLLWCIPRRFVHQPVS
jgi:hypothetical protein